MCMYCKSYDLTESITIHITAKSLMQEISVINYTKVA